MSGPVICRQDECTTFATFKFTWPGKPESAVCAEHAAKLSAVAKAVGLPLQLLVVSADEHATGRLDSEAAT